jgi:hypothetical protein
MLIVLGPKRLPEAGRGFGAAIRGFKESQEAGFKTPVELLVIFEVAAVVAAALAAATGRAWTLPTSRCPTSASWASRPFLLSRSANPDPSETVPRAAAVRSEVGP